MKDNYLAFKEEFDWEDTLERQAKDREKYEDKLWNKGFNTAVIDVVIGLALGGIIGTLLCLFVL